MLTKCWCNLIQLNLIYFNLIYNITQCEVFEVVRYNILSFAQSDISNLSFSYGPQNCHEMTLELVHGADLGRILYHFSSPTRFKGSWGQLGPKTDPKQSKTKTKI